MKPTPSVLTEIPQQMQELEAALPGLIAKLKDLAEGLTAEERLVFSEIIESAALHTNVIQAHDEGDPDILFDKPKSVHSTTAMKAEYLKLPKTLGLKQY